MTGPDGSGHQGPTRRWWLAAMAVVLMVGVLAALIYGTLIRDIWVGATRGSSDAQIEAWTDAASSSDKVVDVTVEDWAFDEEVWSQITIDIDDSVTSDDVLAVLQALADVTDPDEASDSQFVAFMTDEFSLLEPLTSYVSADKADTGAVELVPGDFDIDEYRPRPEDADLPAFEASMAHLSAAQDFDAYWTDSAALRVTVYPDLDVDSAAIDLMLRTVLAHAAAFAQEHAHDEVEVFCIGIPAGVDLTELAVATDVESVGGAVEVEESGGVFTLSGADVVAAATRLDE